MADLLALLDVAGSTVGIRRRSALVPLLRERRRRGRTLRRAEGRRSMGRCRRRFHAVADSRPRRPIDGTAFYANTYGFTALPPSVRRCRVGGDRRHADRDWRRTVWENARISGRNCNHWHQHRRVDQLRQPIVVGENRALLYELGHSKLREHGLFLTPVDTRPWRSTGSGSARSDGVAHPRVAGPKTADHRRRVQSGRERRPVAREGCEVVPSPAPRRDSAVHGPLLLRQRYRSGQPPRQRRPGSAHCQ